MRLLGVIFVGLFIVSFGSAVCFSQSKDAAFYGEEPFRDAVSIPEEVVHSLKKGWQAGCPSRATNAEFSREWFEAIWVDLNSDGFKDLLVKAKDPNECFNGNGISWWGFAGGRKGYRLVFYDYTLSLGFEPTKSNSYFDLWSRRCNGNSCRNTMFKFDGRKYRPRKTWWKPLYVDG